jgi:hypothetical protein
MWAILWSISHFTLRSFARSVCCFASSQVTGGYDLVPPISAPVLWPPILMATRDSGSLHFAHGRTPQIIEQQPFEPGRSRLTPPVHVAPKRQSTAGCPALVVLAAHLRSQNRELLPLRDLLQNEEDMNSWVRSIPDANGLRLIQ